MKGRKSEATDHADAK